MDDCLVALCEVGFARQRRPRTGLFAVLQDRYVRSGIDVNDVEIRSVCDRPRRPLRRDPQPAPTAKTARAGVLELAGSCIVDCAARYRPADVNATLADLEVAALAPLLRCAVDVPLVQLDRDSFVSFVRRRRVRCGRSARHVEDMSTTSNPSNHEGVTVPTSHKRQGDRGLRAGLATNAIVRPDARGHTNAAARRTRGRAVGARLKQRDNIAGRLGRHSGDPAAAVGVDGFPSRFTFAGVRVPGL